MRSVSILWGIVESILCDGVAWRAPDFGLKSHVKARGLQGDDAALAARFQRLWPFFDAGVDRR
ncbi:hypothetical protein THAOC_29520, partial [Thalassiosira oceanica]